MLFCCLWAVHLFQKVCFPEQNGKRPVLRYKKQKLIQRGDALLHQIMEKCWELYYYGDESKRRTKLKKAIAGNRWIRINWCGKQNRMCQILVTGEN